MKTRSQARSDATASLLTSILQPLVDSRYIGAADVGRLAQTSQAMNEAAMEDSIWASFCRREYPGTSAFKSSFLERKGYRWFYKRWSCPVSKRRALPPLLRPPSSKPESIAFCTHIKYHGRTIYNGTISAAKLSPLLMENGAVQALIDVPPILGKVTWNFTERNLRQYEASAGAFGLPVTCNGFDESKLSITTHVFRGNSSDAAMTCIFDSSMYYATMYTVLRAYPLVTDGEAITTQSKIDYSREQPLSLLEFLPVEQQSSIRMPRLRDSEKAAAILQQLSGPVYFEARVNLRVADGDRLALVSHE